MSSRKGWCICEHYVCAHKVVIWKRGCCSLCKRPICGHPTTDRNWISLCWCNELFALLWKPESGRNAEWKSACLSISARYRVTLVILLADSLCSISRIFRNDLSLSYSATIYTWWKYFYVIKITMPIGPCRIINLFIN